MTVEEVKAVETRKVLVGIQLDGHTKELLDWALFKVADPGDKVIALHVCRNSDFTSNDRPLLDGYLDDYEGVCNQKRVDLTGQVMKGNSVRKVLVREAKNIGAMAVLVGINRHTALGGKTSVAKYCAKRLPPTTEVLVINNGKVVYKSSSNGILRGFGGDPRPSFYIIGNPAVRDNGSEFGDSEISEVERLNHEVIQSWEDRSSGDLGHLKYGELELFDKHKRCSLSPISVSVEDYSEQRPGWPLLRASSSLTLPASLGRKMSVVQWVMSLPDRSLLDSPQSKASVGSNNMEDGLRRDTSCLSEKTDEAITSRSEELPKVLEFPFKTNSIGCEWFDREVLKCSTSKFSQDNMIGKGGCNSVYKGCLPDGKTVAVKILKSTKDAWKDFTLEVDIVTSLKHKNIAPLLGICVEENDLMSVYNYYSKGNLEKNLHGNGKQKFILSWELRFNIAVGIAEALNYLHNECSRPVIHRDVKSSNILLSDEYEPQLSDFGLAVWAPTTSSFLTHSDVVGTFGYLAPEYFMYGKVSDKMDVYSFGVVLLELLSGRKPIDSETPRGQESLVMWAKPKLGSGELRSILDPDLENNVNETQMLRVALAASLCVTRAARLRPKMSQILKLLRGQADEKINVKTQIWDSNDSENQDDGINDDEVYPESSVECHLGVALLDADDSATSFSSVDHSGNLAIEEYLKERWSRSSSSMD